MMRIKTLFLAISITSPGMALADLPDANITDYDAKVRKAYVRETKSQCLARQRASTTDIIVCGEVERKDRYRVARGGYILPDVAVIQSPAEKFHETKALIAASQSAVGAGYTSSLTGIKKGYLRGSYRLVTKMIAGEDPDAE
jgi:hypothetical protein